MVEHERQMVGHGIKKIILKETWNSTFVSMFWFNKLKIMWVPIELDAFTMGGGPIDVPITLDGFVVGNT